jgi:hypothetical protein
MIMICTSEAAGAPTPLLPRRAWLQPAQGGIPSWSPGYFLHLINNSSFNIGDDKDKNRRALG